MRVITGSAGGLKLCTVAENDIVRPTGEKAKEGIFSSIQFDIEGRRILDLFAGSGQLGIEALSRGAKEAVFVDISDASLNAVRKNLAVTGFEGNSSVIKSDYMSYLLSTDKKFDIAFLDPPYEAGLLLPALEKISNVMSEFGLVICEHPAEVIMPEYCGNLKLKKHYKYGKIHISVYKRGDNIE